MKYLNELDDWRICMNKILVSVIIPTYKRPIYLSRAIQSVLDQSYEYIELLVVDDNNEGDIYRKETEYLMEKFNDNRINYIKHKTNKNGSAARNTGINNAKGKYVAFLDDDDEFEKDKILEQVNCLETLNDDWIACFTLFSRYSDGILLDSSTDCKSGNLYLEFFKNELYINAGSNIFVKTDIAKTINGFDESFSRMQDLEFTIRVAEQGKILGINKCLLKINVHKEQLKVDYQDLYNYINHFFQKFNGRINKLPKSEVDKIYQAKYLDIFRRAILDKNFSVANSIKKSNKIKICLLIRYIIYLAKRRITKRCYGFKL